MQSAVVAIDAESDFTAAFPAAGLGTTTGLWRFDAGGSSQSTGTGPGGNNALAFMHTETSGGGTLADRESNGLAAFGSVPAQSSRILHLRLAIQGPFGDGTEGLLIEHRAAGGAWAEAGFVHGWAYAADYTAGDAITDENGVDLTCVADGGWVDFSVAIPDSAAEVRLAPKYIVPPPQTSYTHDIALRQFHWSWDAALAPVALAGRATSVPAARGGLTIASDDTRGVVVLVAGEVMPSTLDWWIRRPAGETAEAGARVEGRRAAFARIPQDGDEIEIRAGAADGTLLFGGYLDEPNPAIIAPGVVAFALGAVGWRARLDKVRLPQADGIRIVKLDTAAEQLEALVELVSGEGFTSSVTLADDTPVRDDMRFGFAGPLADHAAALNDGIVTVLPDKAVVARSRSEISADLALGWDILERIGVERSRENFKTSLTVRGGALTRLESHAGRADGRYRLGGENNLEPEQSLFADLVGLGNGVLWQDERARGGASRGDSQRAVLLETADSADLLPASVVQGTDRSVSLLLQAIQATFGAATLLGDDAPLRWRQAVQEIDPPSETELAGVWRFRLATNTGFGGVVISRTGLHRELASDDTRVSFTDGTAEEYQAIIDANLVFAVRDDDTGDVWQGDYVSASLGNSRLRFATPAALWTHVAANPDHSYTVALATAYYAADVVGLRLEGVDLTDDAESDLGIAMQASDGTEYAFPLSDLTGTGGDDSAPYFWPLAVLPFDDVADVLDAIEKLRDGDSKLVIVDTTHARIDFANRALLASDTIVELEVVSLEAVDVDGVEQSIGGSEDAWCWNVATQALEELVPSDPPPTSINVQYKARHVTTETTGGAPHVDAVIVEPGIALPDEARIHARALLELDSRPIEEVVAYLQPGLGEEVVEGTGATIPQDVLDFFAVAGALATDIWRIEEVEIRPRGLRHQYRLRLLRRGARTDARDTWRRTFGAGR